MKNISKFEDFVNEGSVKGSKGFREFQMNSLTTGFRESNIYLEQGRDGKMTVKISAYSGGSDGFKVPIPAKLAKLDQDVVSAYRTSDPEVVKRGEEAEEERYNLKTDIQAEIFDAVSKELEALDSKIEKTVAAILKKY